VRPELTYTALINQPPGRVAATLAPLASLEQEIVLAVDERVDPSWVDGYRQLADRVLLVPYPGSFERIYGWLSEQCRGRWILHLAADEVPSSALAAEVAETIGAEDVTHAWMPRRWLYPDGGSYLAQWPWRPDHQLRLFRNESSLIRFPIPIHEPVGVVGARRFLRAPIYHTDLVIQDAAARERKCAHYEEVRPGLTIDGRSVNEAYYLPERREGLRCASVPDEDAPAIDAFLEPVPPAGPERGSVERFGLDDVIRFSEDRPLDEDDYRAGLELIDDDLRAVCGEWRTFDVEVANLGTTHWPGGMEAHPQIRLGHRWIDAEGERVPDGRTPIGSVLRPGERQIVPLRVLGPDEPGEYRIEIDLVHEHVRWFGCGAEAAIEVRRPGGP
jgi:hypothetical protein